MIFPVILAGGSGHRLWPLSREFHPKQLIALLDEKSLLQGTIERVRSLNCIINKPLIICNENYRFLIAEQLRQLNINAEILLEPESRNTAPAITLAALFIAQQNPDSILLVLPSDHEISDLQAYENAVLSAKAMANKDNLITFGIIPNKVETEYGYIKTAEQIGTNAYRINKFIEKPDTETAQKFCASKEYYWNSGMFMFHVSAFLREMEKYSPDILKNCQEAIKKIHKDLDFSRPDTQDFLNCRNISVDYALLEKTQAGVLIPLNVGWSDLGSWDKLWDRSKKTDTKDNVIKGDVIIHDVENCYIHSSKRLITAAGIKNQIIIETSDAVLVLNKNQCNDIKNIIQRLKLNKRNEIQKHLKVYRPWGSYEILNLAERFQVKKLIINPLARLSLQIHHHRSEHWVIVQGTAKITRGNETFILSENQSTYIPLGMQHRLENPGKIPLEVIEVQSGSYLGENDIIRFHDDYSRQEDSTIFFASETE